ncbi:MAG: cadherin domain-containing protein [Microcystis sp.]
MGNYDASYAKDVQIVGNYAYVADGSGLQIIDISNPAAPTLVDNYITGYAEGVEIVGNYAYVATGEGGLQIIDVSDFNNPSPLPSVTLAVSTTSVTEDGTTNLVYTFTRTGDTTNPLTVNFTTVDNTDSWKTAIFNTDYSQTGAASFPNYSSETGTVTFAANSATATVTIDPTADTTVEDDETVSLTLTSGTDYTVGTTTPVTGTILNDDTRVTLQVSPSLVTEDGTTNLAYFFYRDGVTTNALTVNYTVGGTATLNTDYTQTGAASFNGTTGTVTFAANANNATVTIDPTVDNIADPDETVTLTLASGTGYTVGTTTTVTGTINDDINPPTPTFISKYDTPGWAFGVEVVGNYAYLADYDSGLQIIDISNPSNPIFKGNYDTDGAWDVEVVGNYAYIADGSSGLQIINISNPTNPTFIGNYDNFSAVVDVQVVGNYAYLANGNSLLQIIDISNPTNPILKGNYYSSGEATDVQVVGNYAYLAAGGGGLQIIDISNPTNPTIKGNYQNNYDYAFDVKVVGSYAYVAAREGGLQIIDVSDFNDVNESPTDVTLSNNTVAENSPLNTLIGDFTTTDPDTGNTFTYSLVTGTGDTDNSLFTIDGNQLKTNTPLDYETKNNYSIRVKTTDQGGLSSEKQLTVNVSDVNENHFTFQLILLEDNNNTPGNIITDNIIKGSSFFVEIQLGDIRNNALGLIAASLNINFAADVIQNNDNSFDPTDPNSLLVTPNFPLFRLGTLDNSSGLITNLSGAAFPVTGEGSAIGVNQLSTFSLLRFQVNGTRDDSQLVINLDPNQTGYSDGSVIDPNSITQIQTTLNINDAPIVDAIATTNLSEFSPANTLVTTVNATDDNKTGQAVTFSLLTVPTDNNNNPLFTINSATGEITLTAAGSSIIDYETGPTVYTLGVKASDGYKDSPETTFTVSVSDVNENPTNLNLSNNTVAENSPLNTLIGNFTTTDPDTGNTFTYSLVTGTGSTDNSLFTIDGNQLKVNGLLDYETQNNYSIRVKTTDQGGLSYEKQLTISVSDVNENPTNLNLSNNTVAENSPLNTLIGNFTTTDPDTGNTFTYSLVTGIGSTDNSLFTIDGNQLKTNTTLDYETKNNYSIRVKTTDQGGLSYEKQLTVSVTNLREQGISVDKNAITFGTPLSQYRQGWSNSNLVRPKFADTFRYIDITNTGVNAEDILAISNIEVKASNVTTNANFSQGDILLNPGQTWRVQLTYAPTAARESFNLNDGLVIHSNAINNTAYNVALTGKSTFNSDITYNGKVDRGDLSPLQAAFNSSIGSPKYDPTADINGDSKINLGDFLVLNSDYGLSLI